MPSRFEIVPDFSADAALHLRSAISLGLEWTRSAQTSVRDAACDVASKVPRLLFFPGEEQEEGEEGGGDSRNGAMPDHSHSPSMPPFGAPATSSSDTLADPGWMRCSAVVALFTVLLWVARQIVVFFVARKLLRAHGYAQKT